MLQGKTALVTGSTSGIGLAIAQALADQGANIAFNGFGKDEEIEAVTADLVGRGVEVDYNGADMSKPDQIEAMTAEVTDKFGAVDILVNNAGIQHVAPIEEFETERWDAVIAINLSACFHTTKCVLAGMREKGWGRIINIASVQGIIGSVHKAAYVASKHGVNGLTKVTALETAGQGITCNSICPGWVLTPLVKVQIEALGERKGLGWDDAVKDFLAARTPTQEFVTPEQVGGLAVFLCSPPADNMTGVHLPIDGGWVVQ